jgi:hypothetical protein
MEARNDLPRSWHYAPLARLSRRRVRRPQPTVVPSLRRFRIVDYKKANVRQGPGRNFPVAGTLKVNDVVFVDTVDDGESIGDEQRWVHMARVPSEQADLGFIHWSLVEEIR